jgi:malate dehydrogenase
LFGVTTLDVVRASRFLSEIKGTDPKDTHVTVV